jgi:uncharacterized protein (TIGR00730 family)
MAADHPPMARRTITVFGSSRTRVGEAEYEAAMRLGRLLARRGWTICNGGNEGTMEASARGAKEVGGRTIGIGIEQYRPATPNVWLDEEIVAGSLFIRLEKLVTVADGFVVLRGGIGTLLELALAWNLIQSRQFSHKPLVVVGADWDAILATMRAHLPMHPWESSSPILVGTVDEAVDVLAGRLEALGTPPA